MFDPDDLDALARCIDDHVLAFPEHEEPARLFGVFLDDDDLDLVPLWAGVGRELPYSLVPPAGLFALALASGGWAAPLDDDGGMAWRPSEHPRRRRMHHTAIVMGDGVDIGVLRVAGDEPQVMRGALGLMPERLLQCWERRADAA